jgi:hypothetical protein
MLCFATSNVFMTSHVFMTALVFITSQVFLKKNCVLPLQLGFRRAGDEMREPVEGAGRPPARRPARPDSKLRCRSSRAGTIGRRRAQRRSDDLALFASSWTETKVECCVIVKTASQSLMNTYRAITVI